MEDQARPQASTLPPSVNSHQWCITAQNSAENIVPQVIGCQIGGSLNITVETHTSANPQEQHASAGGANIGSRISKGVTEKLKSRLRRKFDMIFEGLAKRGKPTLLRNIYTELYITEGESGELNKEHEVWQIDTAFKSPSEQDIPISCNDIFRPLSIQNLGESERVEEKNVGSYYVKTEKVEKMQPRTVVTKGIAGIGKTVSVQKFILDWAEGKSNQDIDLLLVLPFRELNAIKDEKHSLHELLLNFHSELREVVDLNYYDNCKILFVFDGLDESKLSLNFGRTRVSNISKRASLEELMVNLIDGNLLPSALIWITSRPAAIDKIPPRLIHRMTEVRGFTDSQKEEYFRKKISDQSMASRIISNVKVSRSLEIMCHIPIFCWITATVLEQTLKGKDEKIPSSLTELYSRFLLIQTSEKKKKYHGTKDADPRDLSEEDVQLILKLGKLAFDNLEKRNIIFSEDDMQEYGIDVTEASLRSGIFTEIVKEEDPMFSEKMYSFVHLSFQEYLAAVYVVHTFAHKGKNLMQTPKIQHTAFVDHDGYDFYGDDDDEYYYLVDLSEKFPWPEMSLYDLQKCAIHKALQSDCGHLDLFLRFLLGISSESNQKLLRSFSMNVESGQRSILQTVQYLKSILRLEGILSTPSPEQCINVFHCLLELNDHTVAEEIQKFLTSDRQAQQKLKAGECSTLAYIILMSGEVLEELDLNKYNIESIEGCRRLVPAVRNCRKAVLQDCLLYDDSCEILASALQSANSRLKELDLSYNRLTQSGVKKIFQILRYSVLEILRLQECHLRDQSCEILASSLQSANSRLKELDLSYNHLTDTGVQKIFQILRYPNLEILRLNGCRTSGVSCKTLRCTLPQSQLKELQLGDSTIGDDGLKEICLALQIKPVLTSLRLSDCCITVDSCEALASALSSDSSSLRELDLSNNDLKDSGLKLLSAGLESPRCKLEILRLSGCMISEEGCSALAAALTSNPSHLRELDLSYNHLGELGKRLLSAKLEDPNCKLETLDVIYGGEQRMKPGLIKYACEVQNFSLTQQDTSEWEKFLEGFSGLSESRFYWQVEWKGTVQIGVRSKDEIAWTVDCDDRFVNNLNSFDVRYYFGQDPKQLGVYLDYPAGRLYFYKVSNDKITNIRTFYNQFNGPIYPCFIPAHGWSDECSVKILAL